MIFLCYLSGSLTARLSGHWKTRFSVSSGIFLGITVSMLGTLVATHESILAMIIGLLFISSGSFFSHSMTYGWVSQKAKTAKASANALYLVHYYGGGGLGGFFLIACWEAQNWSGVLMGSSVLYFIMYLLAGLLQGFEHKAKPMVKVPQD